MANGTVSVAERELPSRSSSHRAITPC
jgi:hypothetical protein